MFTSNSNNIASWLLRLGLAFVFLYAAISSFQDPYSWIGFFPRFLRDLVPAELLLRVFSFYEIALALWLVWGRGLFYASLLSAATVAGIVVFNFGALPIVFRDIAVLTGALALAALSRERR